MRTRWWLVVISMSVMLIFAGGWGVSGGFDPRVRDMIVQEATKRRLDPAAVLSIALGEGGIRFGAVGDGGHAFGPFQMNNAGGVLTGRPGNHSNFANSRAGIQSALDGMVRAGAAGKKGDAALHDIVFKYERPADKQGSFDKARGRYASVAGGDYGNLGKAGKTVTTKAGVPLQLGQVQAPTDSRSDQRNLVLSFLAARSQQLSSGQMGGPSALNLLTQMATIKRMEQQEQAVQQQTGGTLAAPVSKATGQIPGTTKGIAGQIMKIAHAQIGKPYVWGAESPAEGGFDCSGLIDYAYRQAGVKLPGRLTTYTALKLGKSVKGQQYRPGDMVIVNNSKHMVMYAGGGKVIAAPRKGEVVRYQPLSDFNGGIVDVRRVL